MTQLTLGEILDFAKQLKAEGMTAKEIKALPVHIGRDDELNGIHTAWFVQMISAGNKDDADLIELIESDSCNFAFPGKSILIS